MGNVIAVPCRSYSALSFDGCPGCVDAALEAVTQAGMYLVGRSAPNFVGSVDGSVEMTYTMRVRLYDENGVQMATDDYEAEQLIKAVGDGDVSDEELFDVVAEADNGVEEYGDHWTSMRLDDFQTVLDRLELAPSGTRGLSGVIAGRLFGYERSIGGFEIGVAAGH